MPTGRVLPTRLRRFAAAEEGGMTILSLFLVMGMLVIAGIAIDTSRLQARATLLQVTADSAAFAAIEKRVFGTESSATAAALQNARTNMPPDGFGNAVMYPDVEWGVWNAATRTFQPGPASGSTLPIAVRVTARQSETNGNPFTNILLGWVGVNHAEPERVAVATMARNTTCVQGFLSRSRVDIQSNNEFYNGFCIYSGGSLEIQSNGIFEDGVRVLVPTSSFLTFRNNNAGLERAVGLAALELPEVDSLANMIRSLRNSPAISPITPSYIAPSNRTLVTLTASNLTEAQLTPGRMYVANACPLNISGNIDRVVLITDCKVTFANDTVWGSSILATTNTDADSIDGAVRMWIGAPGDCAAGRSSQFLTLGSAKFPANLNADGGQIIAREGVTFTGNAGAIGGFSVIAGGTISGTSNMIMGVCNGTGMNTTLRIPQFRMVL